MGVNLNGSLNGTSLLFFFLTGGGGALDDDDCDGCGCDD